MADVEGLDAVNVDPVAVVALRRALRAGVLDRRHARLGLPEARVAGAVGGAVLRHGEGRNLDEWQWAPSFHTMSLQFAMHCTVHRVTNIGITSKPKSCSLASRNKHVSG